MLYRIIYINIVDYSLFLMKGCQVTTPTSAGRIAIAMLRGLVGRRRGEHGMNGRHCISSKMHGRCCLGITFRSKTVRALRISATACGGTQGNGPGILALRGKNFKLPIVAGKL